MEALLNFIFIIIVIYLVFRLLGRYVLPYLVKRYVNKAKKNFYEKQQANRDNDYDKSKEGEVNIKYKKNQKSKSSKDELGDYIDFEEVEDDNSDK